MEGKVVNGERPYLPADEGNLSIMLSGDGKAFSAQAKPDGTFKFDDAGGVPAGKYSVSVTKYPSKAQMEKLKRPPTPQTKETGETWDIGGSNKSFTLDVSKLM